MYTLDLTIGNLQLGIYNGVSAIGDLQMNLPMGNLQVGIYNRDSAMRDVLVGTSNWTFTIGDLQ